MLLVLVNLCGFFMQVLPLFACMECVKRMVIVEKNGRAMTMQVALSLFKIPPACETRDVTFFSNTYNSKNDLIFGWNILCSSMHYKLYQREACHLFKTGQVYTHFMIREEHKPKKLPLFHGSINSSFLPST